MADIAEISSGIVRGRFLAGILDTIDPGVEPDGVPMTGFVEFTATTEAIKVVEASPAPVTMFPSNLRVELDSDGYLAHMGTRDVRLWATDDVDGNPVNWQWKVSFFLKYAGRDVRYPSFFFSLPADSIVDLTEVSPVSQPSPGVYIIKGAKGDPGEPGGNMTEEDFINLLEEQKGQPSGIASLGEDKKLQASQIPVYLTETALSNTFVALNPDLTITRNADGTVASITENGDTETYTRDARGRVSTITRGGTTKTISRDQSGRVVGVN